MSDKLARFVLGLLICFFGLLIGIFLYQKMIQRVIADGEFACERIHGQVVCWNPKEVKQ